MPSPLEIVFAPGEVYAAPVGEAFPDVNEAPAGNWELIGTEGSKNYDEAGVIIRSPVNMAKFRSLGSTVPRKVSITERDFVVEFTVVDMNPEELSLGYGADPDDIVDTPPGGGDAGERAITIPVSPVPLQRALLVRVEQSPFGEGFFMQWEIFAASQVGSSEGTLSKSTPYGVRHTYEAVENSAGFVVLRIQDAAVSP